jgi:HSP20 family protein
MAMITRYDPFRDVLSLRDAMDRLFQESFVRPNGWTASASTPVDVHETEHGYVVEASLPGWKPEDVNLTFQDGTLTISGQYDEQPEPQGQNGQGAKNWHLRERRFASFSRSFTFPSAVDADKAEAKYENGVLTLTLPKAESAKPRQIKIGAASTAKPIEAKVK